MRRLTRHRRKSACAIALFSLSITCVLILAIYIVYQDVDKSASNQSGILYQLSSEELASSIIDKTDITIQDSRMIPIQKYQSHIQNQVFASLVPYGMTCIVFLFIVSTLFWLYMRRLHDKEAYQLAQHLKYREHETEVDHPMLQETVRLLKMSFDEQLYDQQKLYSYLSHEQKNTLAILKTELEATNHKEYQKKLDDLSSSIDDVLTLSESKEYATMGIVDVSLVCAEVCDQYRRVYPKIAFSFDEQDICDVWGKHRWLFRAISNLVDNAIKYGNNQKVSIEVKREYDCVIVIVKDQGVGIPTKKQDQIFQHSYRVNELNQDGYGIGLSLVRHVCDLCSGLAYVESKEQEGSTFYLSFPAV